MSCFPVLGRITDWILVFRNNIAHARQLPLRSQLLIALRWHAVRPESGGASVSHKFLLFRWNAFCCGQLWRVIREDDKPIVIRRQKKFPPRICHVDDTTIQIVRLEPARDYRTLSSSPLGKRRSWRACSSASLCRCAMSSTPCAECRWPGAGRERPGAVQASAATAR